MKKTLSLVLITAILATAFCGCANGAEESKKKKKKKSEDHPKMAFVSMAEEILADDETHNRILLAEALDCSTEYEALQYLIATLKKIEAGRIRSATYRSEKYDHGYIAVIAEDGTEFWIVLNGADSALAVLNVDTDEWVMRSYM